MRGWFFRGEGGQGEGFKVKAPTTSRGGNASPSSNPLRDCNISSLLSVILVKSNIGS